MKSEIFEFQKMMIALFNEFCKSLCNVKTLENNAIIYHAYGICFEYRLADIPH